MVPETTEHISLRIDSSLRRELDATARRAGITRSELIRMRLSMPIEIDSGCRWYAAQVPDGRSKGAREDPGSALPGTDSGAIRERIGSDFGAERERNGSRTGPDRSRNGSRTGPETEANQVRIGTESESEAVRNGSRNGAERDRIATRTGPETGRDGGRAATGSGSGERRESLAEVARRDPARALAMARERLDAEAREARKASETEPIRGRNGSRTGPETVRDGSRNGSDRDRFGSRSGPETEAFRDRNGIESGPETGRDGSRERPRDGAGGNRNGAAKGPSAAVAGPESKAERHSDGTESGPSTPPAGVVKVLLTDAAWRDMRVELNRWGVNFNQCVKAINTVAKRLNTRSNLTRSEKEEVYEILKSNAKSLRACGAAVDRLTDRTYEIVRDYAPRRVMTGPETGAGREPKGLGTERETVRGGGRTESETGRGGAAKGPRAGAKPSGAAAGPARETRRESLSEVARRDPARALAMLRAEAKRAGRGAGKG